MHGITSLDGHSKSSGDMNKAMERMSIVFKGRLSPEQLGAIKQDIQSTVMGGMLAGAGEGGDTMMAHMSPDTIGMAQEMGILPQGQMNETTGLPAFRPSDDAAEASADASQGQDPAEVGEQNAPSVATEAAAASVGQADLDAYDRAFSGLMSKQQEIAAMNTGHRGYDIAAKTQGIPPSMMQGLTQREKRDLIDRVEAARVSVNPTMSQLDDLAATERGFQTTNPGISQAVGIAGTLAGLAVPGVGLATTLGNVANTMMGRQTLVDLALDNPTATSTALSGITDFGSNVASTLGELAESVPGDPDTDVQEPGGMNEEDPFVPDEDEKDTSLEENLGPDAERAKILGMGYSPADASLILDNFGTLDTFEQRFTGRFNRAPSPEMLTSPDARSFLNIQRGRPVGIGSLMT